MPEADIVHMSQPEMMLLNASLLSTNTFLSLNSFLSTSNTSVYLTFRSILLRLYCGSIDIKFEGSNILQYWCRVDDDYLVLNEPLWRYLYSSDMMLQTPAQELGLSVFGNSCQFQYLSFTSRTSEATCTPNRLLGMLDQVLMRLGSAFKSTLMLGS